MGDFTMPTTKEDEEYDDDGHATKEEEEEYDDDTDGNTISGFNKGAYGLPMSSSLRRLHRRIDPKKINEVERYQEWVV